MKCHFATSAHKNQSAALDSTMIFLYGPARTDRENLLDQGARVGVESGPLKRKKPRGAATSRGWDLQSTQRRNILDAADDTTLAVEDASETRKSARPAKGIKRAFIPEYAIDDNRLSRAQFRVLAKIYCYYNPQKPANGCWPTQETIAEGLGIKRTHVNRAINDLAALGYLEIRKKGRRNYYYPSDSAPSNTYQNAHPSNTYQNAHPSNTYQNAHPSSETRTNSRTLSPPNTYQFADTEHTIEEEQTIEEQTKAPARGRADAREASLAVGDFENGTSEVSDEPTRKTAGPTDPFPGIWDYQPPADPDAEPPPLVLTAPPVNGHDHGKPGSASQPEPRKKRKKTIHVFVLPDWIPAEKWDAFEDMRRKLRKPMTEYARKLIVKQLVKFRDESMQDPLAILDQSTRNGWQDVFPLRNPSTTARGNGNGTTNRPKSSIQAYDDYWKDRRAKEADAGRTIEGASWERDDGQSH